MIRLALSLLFAGWMAQSASAQLLIDTLFTWQGYGRQSICRVQIYKSASGEERTRTIIIDELAHSNGPTILDDVRHLAELLGRNLSLIPEKAYWVFHWGAFSFPGATESRKELFLRATFRRSGGGALGPPAWRVVDRETIVKYTDRAYR